MISVIPYRIVLKSILTLGFSLGLAAIGNSPVLAQRLPLSEELTDLTSVTGNQLLQESEAQADYIALTSHFVTQVNQAYCGVASIAMVLNALGIPAPETTAWNQNYFTQTNVLDEQTATIIPAALIQRQGLTLEELGQIFARHGVGVDRFHGADVSLGQFRQLLVQNLQTPQDFIVINYLRRAIGQESGGHISPIAAYHEATDQVLVLDVSRYKYPPVWVSTETLWQAINTVDSVSDQTRGFLLVTPPAP
jgi:hypothetical protein